MAFCEDSPPISDSHSAASDLTPSPQTENCELDYDIEQEFYSGDAEADQYMGPERIFTDTPYQGEDGSFSINEDFRQADDVTCTNNQKVYGEGNYGTWHASQETSLKNFGNLQKEELSHAVHNTQDWASQNSSYRPEDGYASQWYSSAPQNQVGTREKELKEEKWEMSLAAAQSYHQQQPQNQYMAADHPSRLTSSAGHHGSPGESNYLNAAWNNEYPRLDLSAHSGSIAPQPRVQSLETEQRYQRTYMEFTNSHVHTTPQSYMAQPPAYQGIYIGHGVMSVPDYSYDLNYSNLCYGAYSDHSYRDTGLPGLMPRSVGGAPPFMSTYPNLNSAYVATPYGDQSSAQGSGVPIE
ncbi:hypothetical protein INR49_031845 [Caranx melampygus]|nr:hypothetical protein INR49_031845 [Caranx melampygus]